MCIMPGFFIFMGFGQEKAWRFGYWVVLGHSASRFFVNGNIYGFCWVFGDQFIWWGMGQETVGKGLGNRCFGRILVGWWMVEVDYFEITNFDFQVSV